MVSRMIVLPARDFLREAVERELKRREKAREKVGPLKK
jgi:hypothetical protein